MRTEILALRPYGKGTPGFAFFESGAIIVAMRISQKGELKSKECRIARLHFPVAEGHNSHQ